MALTDHGTLSGAPQFVKQCKKSGIKPILGIEAYYAITDKGARERDVDGERYYHTVLLAQNETGWKNLMALSSKAYSENLYYKPRVTDDMLAQHSEGILATSACLGSRYSKLILLNRSAEAERLLVHHAEMFKDRFFIELQLHADEKQQTINKTLIDISKRRNIPMVLTSDAHYTHAEHKTLHEQALCMQTNDVMYNPKRFSFGEIDVHLGSPEYMANAALECGIPLEALTNTVEVANLCDGTYFTDIRNRFTFAPNVPEDSTPWETLEYNAKVGLIKRFGGRPPEAYKARLMEELMLIKKMDFSDYMLLLEYIVNYARAELDVYVGPGRGSAGGCLVAYALGITQVDPVKYDLLFSRFLSSGRSANPLHFTPEMKALLS